MPGGLTSPVGVISIDNNQSFGSESPTFQTTVFPGYHLISSSSPVGYLVFYSVCMNCTAHSAASYVFGSSATVAVPIGGSVNVSWLYTPQNGTLQGLRVLSNGSAFLLASLTVDATPTFPLGFSPFTSTFPGGLHTIVSSTPAGYAVSSSICMNCTMHPASSFTAGSSVTVQVPANAYVDVQFQYTSTASLPFLTSSPSANQTISGDLTLSVSGTGFLKAASVEYTLGTYRIARVAAQASNPNFQITWKSALASDGNSQIEVVARDYLDNIIFQDIRPVTLSNFGNTAAMPLPASLTGSVPVVLNAYDKLHNPAYWQVFLDGEILPGTTGLLFSDQDGTRSNSRTTTLDTTLYPNGRHELHFAFHSNDYPAASSSTASLDFRGMVTQNVTIDNGRALMEILPNYLFVYTPVSTGIQLTCGRAYTDGSKDGCGAPTYSVNTSTSSPGIQVSASGVVFGSQEGYGDIQVTDSGKSALVHVLDSERNRTSPFPGRGEIRQHLHCRQIALCDGAFPTRARPPFRQRATDSRYQACGHQYSEPGHVPAKQQS